MRSKYIDKNTVSKLRGAIGAEEWLPMRISIETGLRIGDVVDLMACQIHKKRDGKAYIHATTQKRRKTGDFLISDGLYKILRDRVKRLHLEKTDFIFPSYGESGHLTRQCIWRRMKRAAELLGISGDGISPHSLRKCFAVALRHERGVEAVRKALQHDNTAVTRIYAYADTILNYDSDAPVQWRDIEYVVEYILERLKEH